LAAAQDRAREEREKLQMILDCMADAVLYVTPDGKVRQRNRAAQHFWPAEALPEDDLRVCHPAEQWDHLIEKVSAVKSVGLHPVFQVRGRSYEASYAPVCDANGTFRGAVMVARDVTERIETQQWRIRGEQLAVVGKLAAALAHELNNPLGAIALFTQHALAEIDPRDPLAEYLGTVKRNANLCKKIVRDLLEYARRRPPERQLVAIRSLMGDVVRTLEPHAQTSGVAIRSEFNIQRDTVIFGDPDQLRQTLVNLGLNSIEAMPNGGLLNFRLYSLPGGPVRIAVVDTGVGIPAEEHERIFTAFHTTKPQGTGLGLTVARDLVAAHGGTIEFESTRGQGSTFTITLPGADRAVLAEGA
jgi:two-component system sensor histidine kinase AtoS